MVQKNGSRERRSCWTVLHAQCTSAHLLSFLFHKHLTGQVGKQSISLISYFLRSTSAKIIVIGLCMSILQQVKGGTFFETQCTFILLKHYVN